MDQPCGLFPDDADDPRMILAEGIHTDAGDEIEIPLAGGVPHIGTVAANQNQRMTRVVLEQIPTLEFNYICNDVCTNVLRGRLPANRSGH